MQRAVRRTTAGISLLALAAAAWADDVHAPAIGEDASKAEILDYVRLAGIADADPNFDGDVADDALSADRVRLMDVSIALWHELAAGLTAALEVRHDWSGDDVFLDGSGDPIDAQDTLTLSLLYRF